MMKNKRNMMKAAVVALGVAVLTGCQGSGASHVENPTSIFDELKAVQVTLELPASRTDAELGQQALEQGKYRVAELHLSKALVKDPGNGQIATSLASAIEKQIPELLDANDQNAALKKIYDLHNYSQVHFNYETKSPGPGCFVAVAELEASLKRLQGAIVQDTVKKAWDKIGVAQQHADDAYNHLWWNDRDEIRASLTQLCWIRERWECVDQDVRARYMQIVAECREMVSDKEWDSLVAGAGFVGKAM